MYYYYITNNKPDLYTTTFWFWRHRRDRLEAFVDSPVADAT